MPVLSTVFLWLGAHREFSEQYARAREAQADALFDEALDIADTPVIGAKTVTKAGGVVEKTEGDMIEHRRLQVDTRKWIVGKLAPKKYGDKSQVELSGPGGGPIETKDAGPRERISRRIAGLAARGAADSDPGGVE